MQSSTWIYSLANDIDDTKADQLRSDFDKFTQVWNSHGTPVDGLVRIYYHRFIVIQADPKVVRPSGCSIDSLKHAVARILSEHQLECLDAAYVFYKVGEEINAVHFQKIPQLVADGTLAARTIVFDHSLNQSDDLSKWEMPMEETWLRRFLRVKQ